VTSPESGTWHYGLVARWWAEFNAPEPREVDYYGTAIRRFGEPALDLGCGTGRILVPLLEQGLDVDGVDISADMIGFAAARAAEAGYGPLLVAQALHELELPRQYRTIYVCGVFGIGGDRDHDRLALRRAYEHLGPGGVLLLWHELPWEGHDQQGWARWLPGHREDLPRPWRTVGDRRRAADGDEIELISRLVDFDPYRQRQVLEMRARLWHDGELRREEASRLAENLYFAQEVLFLLEAAGFREVRVEAAYEDRPATADDGTLVFVARRDAHA
jgi:SAM-dependent methyltransferase